MRAGDRTPRRLAVRVPDVLDLAAPGTWRGRRRSRSASFRAARRGRRRVHFRAGEEVQGGAGDGADGAEGLRGGAEVHLFAAVELVGQRVGEGARGGAVGLVRVVRGEVCAERISGGCEK